MEGDKGVACGQSSDVGSVRLGQQAHQRVDHHVAHALYPLVGDALASEILIGIRRGREEQVGKLVGD